MVFGDANAVHGTVTCWAALPPPTFTPSAGYCGTASFEYRISRTATRATRHGTVTITVTPPSHFELTQRCTDGVLRVHRARAERLRRAQLHLADQQRHLVMERLTYDRFHGHPDSVRPPSPVPQQQASTTANITYAAAPRGARKLAVSGSTWTIFDLTMFMATFTTVVPTISGSPADCAEPRQRMRAHRVAAPIILAGCRSVMQLTAHTDLRRHAAHPLTGSDSKDYPVAIEAVNQYPVPRFTVSRPDPNVRSFLFTNADGGDDGPFPLTYEWDFGDGTRDTGPEDKTHLYAAVGVRTASLTVTDGEGLAGVFSLPVNVTNAVPVPRMTVNCQLLDCDLGGESSTDDGSNITLYEWDFGDGTTGAGARLMHHYAAGGCYNVTLKLTDGDGGIASITVKVVAGPPLVSTNTRSWSTRTCSRTLGRSAGDGLEHHEREPQRHPRARRDGRGRTDLADRAVHAAAPGQLVRRFSLGQSIRIPPHGAVVRHLRRRFRLLVPRRLLHRVRALAIRAEPAGALRHPVQRDQPHHRPADAGQPGHHPRREELQRRRADTYWSYPGIESVLHGGVDSGCGGTQFCPGTVVTRGEAARWLLKAEHGGSYQPPACTASPFTDVPCSHAFAAWIAQLKAEGLTSGLGDGNYGPDQALSRAEAAVLLLRTRMGPSTFRRHARPTSATSDAAAPAATGPRHGSATSRLAASPKAAI